MKCKSVLLFFALLFFVSVLPAFAGGCLNGSCHKTLLESRYVHGPVAAEAAGVNGCAMCHESAGPACTADKGGKFKPFKKSQEMCQACHVKGTGSVHSDGKLDCLKCHDPHGSETSGQMQREK
ncbi:MAG: hypothetical protein KKB30_15955 [Proteobacteria bacterium]|nr:hypothetical protein [Pseudomonadota bacterium]MBU1714010.1 hypothetical protein [Pseudomonadota bacterium]